MLPTPLIVGIGHRVGAGKDTAAKFFIEQGFTRLAFGDSLKEELLLLMGETLKEIVRVYMRVVHEHGFSLVLPYEEEAFSTDENKEWWDVRLRKLLWEEKPPIVRRILQEYGTEVRRGDDENYWVQKLAQKIKDKNIERVVISDLRFQSEARWIKYCGGFNIKIIRDSVPILAHSGEHDLNGWLWDAVIQNNSTVEDLGREIYILARDLKIFPE